MKMTVGEDQAQLDDAVAAAGRGERVTITLQGEAAAVPESVLRTMARLRSVKGGRFSFERNEEVRRELGLDKREVAQEFLDMFDDPALSRRLLGLPDDWKAGPA